MVFSSFLIEKKMLKALSLESVTDPVAQLVEQLPFKPWVVGSSPTRITVLSPYKSSY